MRPMTPLPRDLHPSNGRRVPGSSGDVVVPLSAAGGRSSATPEEPLPHQLVGTSDALGRTDDGLTEAEEPYPSELQHSILEMLSSGGDDEMIARRLGLDLNGYRALVAEMAATAGACNRFQLALKARELGWL